MKFARQSSFPAANCDRRRATTRRTRRARPGGRVHLAQGHRPEGRRRRDPARRVRPRRLPAHRRDGALLADHARGAGVRRPRRSGARHLQRFQILLEAGLLPGAMLRNRGLKFRCEHVHVRVEQTDTPFTGGAPSGPGAADADRARRRQLLRAARRARAARSEPAGRSSATPTPTGEVDDAANPNGSVHAIAGLCNEARNVVGLMPHPERACEPAARQRRRPA